jgi:hypothetical protein
VGSTTGIAQVAAPSASRFQLLRLLRAQTGTNVALPVSNSAKEDWVPMRLPLPALSKLGLKLKRKEDAVPVYTVERIERPAGN